LNDGAAPRPSAVFRRGLILVLSSPSGAGKSTIARALLEADRDLVMSVSVTTRPARPGEVDGRDYRFIDRSTFERLVAEGELLEHATVFGNYYGTPRAAVREILAEGRDMLFDVDWQGARQLRANAGENVVSVFILPPSRSELARRLRTRAQDTDDVVRARMAKATDEIAHWGEYDYVIVNRVIEDSVRQAIAILGAERLRRERQTGLAAFVEAIVRS
jgi:guanylate kinase